MSHPSKPTTRVPTAREDLCKGEYWATRKFKKFITDNIDESIWEKEDDLFKPLPNWKPQRADLEKLLGRIYAARSKATHSGEQFPLSASYAGGPQIPAALATSLMGTDPVFPPVAWFERLVNNAVRNFWKNAITAPPDATPRRSPSPEVESIN